MTHYKGHRKERTASLHQAYDTMTREEALSYAVDELGYTAAGAAGWFSWWARPEKPDCSGPKKPAAKKKAPAKPKASKSTPTAAKKPASTKSKASTAAKKLIGWGAEK